MHGWRASVLLADSVRSGSLAHGHVTLTRFLPITRSLLLHWTAHPILGLKLTAVPHPGCK